MTPCRFLNYLCRNGQTVPCLPSKQFDEFYRLYRSLRDRYLSTVVGGQCVANKHVKVPFARTFRCFRRMVLPFCGRGDIFVPNLYSQTSIDILRVLSEFALSLQLLPVDRTMGELLCHL
jgi:hypothetical protein